jgi:hypothetical protein
MTGACSSDQGAAFKNPDGGIDASMPEAGGSAGKGAGGAGASTGGRVISDGGAAGTGGRAGAGGSGGKAGSGNGGAAGKAGSGNGGSAGASEGGLDAAQDANPCRACPSGACLPDGGCAECVLDKHCPAELPRCDTARNKCVACLATPTDNCEDGKYCSANECIPGCKANGGGCASGACTAEHECTSCIADSECLSGHVCSSGICSPGCGHDGDCAGTQTCCKDRCAELSRDKDNCLGCGVACSLQQFCGRSGCAEAIMANACKSAVATFLKDGLDIDDAMDEQLRDGMLANCPDKPTVRLVSQTESPTVNPVTGQPVVGSGDLQVIVGGPYGQNLIRYLESTGATRISDTYDGNGAQFHLRGADGGLGTVIVDAPIATLNEHHDFFLVEMLRDPTTSTLVFAVYGFGSSGTISGTWYFTHVILTSLPTFDKSYYIYEWTDSDGDSMPGSADTFDLVTSGL